MHGTVAAYAGCALRGAIAATAMDRSSSGVGGGVHTSNNYGSVLGSRISNSFNGVSVPVQNGGCRRRVCRRWRVVGSSESNNSNSSNNGHKRVQPAQAFSKHHAAVNMLAIEPLACSGLQHEGVRVCATEAVQQHKPVQD